jgi:putative ABC transport system permease protein
MAFIGQVVAVCRVNLRNVPQRMGSSLVIVIGVAAVVAVFISVLSLAQSFRRTIADSGRPDRAVILIRGVQSESISSLSREDVRKILDAPGIRKGRDGRPFGSAEAVVLASVSRKSDGADAFITLRGVGPEAFAVRKELKLVAGRMYKPGLHELLVGRAAQRQFTGFSLGSRVRLGDGDWMVVGAFTSGGSSLESTLLADADTVLAAYKRNAFNSVTVLLQSPNSLDLLRQTLSSTPGLLVDVWREPEYLASLAQPLNRLLSTIAYVIGAIMAVGAVFGVLNTMYTAVSSRRTEIATLRAVGFSGLSIVVSVLMEALLLAGLGAIFGVMTVYAALDGRTISTIGDALGNNPQLVYSLNIGPFAVVSSVALACAVGLLGGVFPALRAAYAPVADALRSS